ncbi:type 4 prepilin peptidase 1 Aspartic peptidase. MEROPS family A24A [Sphingomonas sp. OV641]|uniref:prepilin peptidase n=1 Tax=Sphingomonas sp. OV641 TaxID=1881068 RepID=UPI0008C28609|nr:A24 family peptidase [Sphingomonas sp. OV641]SEI95647.1 type 4 prepilin peptidase 1 Aspartic peptidase. MEROPS family A24A [Sphingomonas sp. OV641]
MSDFFWPLGLSILGAIFGSFLATVAIRWPAGRSALSGRSLCDGCGRPVAARDLVPVLSALLLRGRARCCGGRISRLHSAVEIACAICGLTAGLVASDVTSLVIAAFGWLLVLVAALDATELWIPDPLIAVVAVTGLATAVLLPPPVSDRLIGGAAGFGSLWLIGFAYLRLRGQEGLGGADPKLFGAIGLWLGWRLLPAVLLFAAMIGLGMVALRLAAGRAVARDEAVPFGAYLAAAAYPALLLMVHLET